MMDPAIVRTRGSGDGAETVFPRGSSTCMSVLAGSGKVGGPTTHAQPPLVVDIVFRMMKGVGLGPVGRSGSVIVVLEMD